MYVNGYLTLPPAYIYCDYIEKYAEKTMHIYICIFVGRYIVKHYMFYVAVLIFMLPAYRTNFAEVAHTSRQIALYLTSAELRGCLAQPQCILIVEICLKVFLFSSCQKDRVPEFCNANTL